MTVNYGRMRDIITVQTKNSEVVDTHTTDEYIDAAVVRGRVIPNTGRKFFEAAAVNAERLDTVIVRYKPIITENCRLKYNGIAHRVESVKDIENRHLFMEIKCEAIVDG